MSDESHQNPLDDRSLDRTFIEGSDSVSENGQRQPGEHTELNSGKKIDAHNLSTINPYDNDRILPSGKEQIPLGTGVVVGILGTGGMARIFKIWNERLEVFRAIKILLPTYGKDLTERFETEAKITAKLHHPNIVEIYTVGEYNSLPFLEMELIDGESLDAIIHRIGRIAPEVVSAIGIFIARGLSYAHNQEFLLYGKTYKGIIHRDLKPANIMISKSGQVKLMDFGIARPTDASLHTVDGNVVGTMQYLSPEQLDGVSIDRRSDIYSLGTILYEALTGEKTFPQATITNLMRKKATGDYRTFNEFDFPIHKGLRGITEKCLRLNREERFKDAEQLQDTLEKVHRSMTDESPERIMQRFMADPAGYLSTASKRNLTASKTFPRALVIWVAVMVFSVLAIAVIAIGWLTKPSQLKDLSRMKTLLSAEKDAVKEESSPSGDVPHLAQKGNSSPAQQAQEQSPPKAETPRPSPPKPVQTPRKPVSPPAPAKKTTSLKAQTIQKQPPRTPERETVEKQITAPNPLEELEKKYGSSDPIDIAEKASARSAWNDAITILEPLPATHAKRVHANALLLEAYIETNQIRKARDILPQITRSDDAQFDILRGRLELKGGNYSAAKDYFGSALTKPSSLRPVQTIRNDALYHLAEIADTIWQVTPNNDTRIQALNAWNVVKRSYYTTPEHTRFKKANRRLAEIN